MALCTSCGNQVEESASFCTSCGKPMPAAAHSSATVTATRPICSSCGVQCDPGSVFCTECGRRLDAQAEVEAVSTSPSSAASPVSIETAPETKRPTAFCINCGSKLESETGFCTNCGQSISVESTKAPEPERNIATQSPAPEAAQPVRIDPIIATPVGAEQTVPIETKPGVAVPAPSAVEIAPATVSVTSPVEDRPMNDATQPAPQIAAPVYSARSDYPPAQPGGGAFRVIVLVLLLVIVVSGFGGWYFMGVETVIVCSPPDVTVFLDDKEVAPESYGRYVVPHLSRQAHLLKVQRPGFADTVQRLDFSFTSLHEWVNIKLVPHRQLRSPSRQ